MISLYIFALASISVVSAAPIPMRMVDLTYILDEKTQNAPIYDKFEMKVGFNGTFKDDIWIQFEEMSGPTHIGTHVDASSHFTQGGADVDDIPLSKLISPAAVVDITDKAGLDPDAYVTVDDLLQWETDTGLCLDEKVILLRTGWGKHWTNRTAFVGNADNDFHRMHFPGLDPEAARWLVENRKAHGIGIDTLSFDRGSRLDQMSHRILLPAGYFGIENVANMELLPICGVTLYVMPMKVVGASGAPARVVGTFPDFGY